MIFNICPRCNRSDHVGYEKEERSFRCFLCSYWFDSYGNPTTFYCPTCKKKTLIDTVDFQQWVCSECKTPTEFSWTEKEINDYFHPQPDYDPSDSDNYDWLAGY
jgi:DNA-directed RNA polymerase subunit RPC12/RpoP